MNSPEIAGRLDGLVVAFTGQLASMSRRDALQLVSDEGGTVRVRVSRSTDLLIIGSDGWPLRRSGQLTINLQRAEQLQAAGAAIEVLSEDAFLERLGRPIDNSVRRHHTLEQLSRMIGVRGLRLRRWIQRGLLRPIEPASKILEFDYAEVSVARMLVPLLKDSRRQWRTQQSLERLRRWLPQDRRLNDHLVRLRRQLAVRDQHGRLLDAHGQYFFRFDEPTPAVDMVATAKASSLTQTEESLLRAAHRRHRKGKYAAAIRLYRRWLKHYRDQAADRTALVLYDLGNAYQSLGRVDLATRAFQRSVRLDPFNPHAWNNLGLSLAAAGGPAAAVKPLRRALKLNPDYCEACYNLADILDELGHTNEARLLWRRYLSGPACGNHRDYALQRLSTLTSEEDRNK